MRASELSLGSNGRVLPKKKKSRLQYLRLVELQILRFGYDNSYSILDPILNFTAIAVERTQLSVWLLTLFEEIQYFFGTKFSRCKLMMILNDSFSQVWNVARKRRGRTRRTAQSCYCRARDVAATSSKTCSGTTRRKPMTTTTSRCQAAVYSVRSVSTTVSWTFPGPALGVSTS